MKFPWKTGTKIIINSVPEECVAEGDDANGRDATSATQVVVRSTPAPQQHALAPANPRLWRERTLRLLTENTPEQVALHLSPELPANDTIDCHSAGARFSTCRHNIGSTINSKSHSVVSMRQTSDGVGSVSWEHNLVLYLPC